jgi:hypothetical protein
VSWQRVLVLIVVVAMGVVLYVAWGKRKRRRDSVTLAMGESLSNLAKLYGLQRKHYLLFEESDRALRKRVLRVAAVPPGHWEMRREAERQYAEYEKEMQRELDKAEESND